MELAGGPVVAAGRLSGFAQPHLRAADLLLRPIVAADAPVLVRAFGDPEIGFWNLEPPVTMAEAAAQIAEWEAQWAAEQNANWLVVDADGGEPLGRMALRQISLFLGVAEAAYWTLPAARRRGVASRALRTMAVWALTEVGLGRIFLKHSDRNRGSCRVAEKAGFTFEGIQRHALRHADGWHDMHLHSLVRPDLPESTLPPDPAGPLTAPQ